MSKPKFKVGDKVRLNHNARKNFVSEKYIGVEGEIVDTEIRRFLVKVPKRALPLRVSEKAIDLIRPEKIIIYRNGAEVVAKNTATGKTGVARCNPADEFDFSTGAKLAFERLINSEPVKPKYYSGKVVCIKSLESFSIVGKIYNVKDGILDFENGLTSTTRLKSIDDINIHCKSKYIELVE